MTVPLTNLSQQSTAVYYQTYLPVKTRSSLRPHSVSGLSRGLNPEVGLN